MRRWLLPVGLYAAIAVAFSLPLLPHFGSAVAHDAGDPILVSWILWWSTQKLPLTSDWWNAPMFYPMHGAMALSELLIGLLPISAPVQFLTGNPLAAYNTAFALSFILTALGGYALALELTGRRDAATVSGIAFAFAPYKMGQLAHLQMLAYFAMPVGLLALHRFIRTRALRWLSLFGAAWLLQALCNGYSLFHFGTVIVLWLVWFARPSGTRIPIVLAWVVASVPLLPVLLKYRQVHSYLHLARSIDEIKEMSADLGGFLAAPSDIAAWGATLLHAAPEGALFPGATVVLIATAAIAVRLRGRPRRSDDEWPLDRKLFAAVAALAGVVALSAVAIGPWSLGRILRVGEFHKPFTIAIYATLLVVMRAPSFRRAWQERSVVGFYLVGVFTMYLLALGPAPLAFGRPFLYESPYAWLMRLPGFDTMRVPARFAMPALLCQSVLVAIALTRWFEDKLERTGRYRCRVAVVIISAGLLLDGWVRLPVAFVSQERFASWRDVASIIELPPGEPGVDFPALYRAMGHRHPIVNGYSGYMPPHYAPLMHALRTGRYSALREVASYGTLGIALDRSRPDFERIASELSKLSNVRAVDIDESWARFVAPMEPRHSLPLGSILPINAVRANHHQEDIARLTDGRLETAWSSGDDQTGTEELVVDLSAKREVGGIVFLMGGFAFGFPRWLVIETSLDRSEWKQIWDGETSVLTLRAALADAAVVPLTIVVPTTPARFLRLRQVGQEPNAPWWIAELKVHGTN